MMGPTGLKLRTLVIGVGLIGAGVLVGGLIGPGFRDAVRDEFPGAGSPNSGPAEFAIADEVASSTLPPQNTAVAAGVFGPASRDRTQPIPEFMPAADSSRTFVGYIRWLEVQAAEAEAARGAVEYNDAAPSSLLAPMAMPELRMAVYNRDGVRIGALVNGTYLPGDLLPTPGEGAPVSPPEQLPAEQPTTPPTASTT